MENPIVEWAHRFDIPAIGKMEGLTIDDTGLHGLVYFNDKSFDFFGWSIGQRVKAGVIRAGSVGFRVMEIEIPSKADSMDGTSLIFRKQELLEFSICNVPANPWALVKPNALTKSIEAMKTETTQELNCPTFWGGLINNL
jgi:HK97 family phage prohead protease